MVVQAAAAAGVRVAAKKAATKTATRNTSRMTPGIHNAKIVTRRTVDRNTALTQQRARTPNAASHRRNRFTNAGEQSKTHGSESAPLSAIAEGRREFAFFIGNMVAWPLAAPQLVMGVLTIISLVAWIGAEELSWGLSDYILPTDIIFTINWGAAIVLGLLSLAGVTFILLLVGKIPIFSRFSRLFLLVIFMALTIFPMTSFIPFGLIFLWIIRLTHHRKNS
ncbi:hypothetical protein KC722_01060 [Candidatus Kaiserbacteria bacterium]|nr:hypothetical protein [Candidatus Kaiserbacteria bacterium]MCB9811507.1 hypothetical protein [Candidatus Nomurabacteria bacterium]